MRTLSDIFLALLVCALAFVFIGPFFIEHSPNASHLESALQPPNREFYLGTDGTGRDILAQILHGGGLSLFISVVVVFNCSLFGTFAGFIAGYRGGFADRIFLAVADVFQAFPGILLAIFIAAFLPQSPVYLVALLSFVGWVGYARVVRSQVIEMKSREFILASRSIGVPLPRLLFRHFLPNMLGPLIVQMSFGMAGVMLAESTLSFLGLGLPDHVPSLGKLMDSGVNLLLVAPHVALFPGLVIMAFVLLFNLTGDRLREKLV